MRRWPQATPHHRRRLLVIILLISSATYTVVAFASSSRHGGRPPMLLRRLASVNRHRYRPRHRPALLSAMASTSTGTTTAEIAVLRQSILDGLRRRLRPVQHLDTDARRYAESREAFRGYLLGRFGLASLVAQGEESSVRSAVHAHLLHDNGEKEYRRLVEEELPALEDPWAVTTTTTDTKTRNTASPPFPRFRPAPARITSASQRDAYLPAARAGLAAVEKAMAQLSVGVEKARERLLAASGPEEAPVARAALVEREARLGEMAARKGRFEALLSVLERVEARLLAARAAVLARAKERARAAADAAAGVKTGGGPAAPSSSVLYPPPRDTTAWGKQAEREARVALEAVLAEVNTEVDGPPLRLLASVLLKALDGPEMVAVREEALAAGGARLYGGDVGRPKGEIDLLVVRPAPHDPPTLQVVLVVEVKRSLDEVPADCQKLHLLLDMCARIVVAAAHDDDPSAAPRLRFACGGGGGKRGGAGAGPSTEGGQRLDFAFVGLPAGAAVYLATRGGRTLRAVSKLMLEVVQLVKTEEGEEEEGEAGCRVGERLRAFYAPDFVDDDDGGGGGGSSSGPSAVAAAEAAREAVVDELWDRFRSDGVGRLEARLGRVARALTRMEGGGEGVGLSTVFTLGDGGSVV